MLRFPFMDKDFALLKISNTQIKELILPIVIPFIALMVQYHFWIGFKPFVWFLFYPIVFFMAWLGGLRGAIISSVLSAVIVWWFFMPPVFSLYKESFSAYFSTITFIALGYIFGVAMEQLIKANQKVAEQLEANRQKEQLVIQQSKMAAMGEMIGAIAHQWRQPLSIIGGSLINIEESYDENELTKEYLKKQIDSAEKNLLFMSKTIDDFRNFFSPSKSKTDFSVYNNLLNSISIMNAQMESHQISITYDVKDSNANTKTTENEEILDNHFMTNGFSNEFSQVLVNLFANAKDAIEENIQRGMLSKGEGAILITLFNEKNNVVIIVKDNGGGISEKIIDRIFEPYFTTKEQGKGTGIGLYMSKMIIEENMNGKLEVFNDSNGAFLKITLAKAEVKDEGK